MVRTIVKLDFRISTRIGDHTLARKGVTLDHTA